MDNYSLFFGQVRFTSKKLEPENSNEFNNIQ